MWDGEVSSVFSARVLRASGMSAAKHSGVGACLPRGCARSRVRARFRSGFVGWRHGRDNAAGHGLGLLRRPATVPPSASSLRGWSSAGKKESPSWRRSPARELLLQCNTGSKQTTEKPDTFARYIRSITRQILRNTRRVLSGVQPGLKIAGVVPPVCAAMLPALVLCFALRQSPHCYPGWTHAPAGSLWAPTDRRLSLGCLMPKNLGVIMTGKTLN